MMRDLRLLNTSVADHRLHGFQPAVCRLDDARLLCRGAARSRRSGTRRWRLALGALVRVVLPLVAPGLAATAVFCLIVSWNEFLFAARADAD